MRAWEDLIFNKCVKIAADVKVVGLNSLRHGDQCVKLKTRVLVKDCRVLRGLREI